MTDSLAAADLPVPFIPYVSFVRLLPRDTRSGLGS